MAQGSHLWGRVSSDVSSDVCMGEARKYCWIRFWSVGQGRKIDDTFPCYLGSMLV